MGTALAYAASSISLAALEYLVHVDPDLVPDDLVVLELQLPDAAPTDIWAVGDLPPDWRATSAPASCHALGDAWVARAESLVLRAPSVLIPTEQNVLLNPAHAAMRDVRVVSVTPFQFDPRLLA